MMRGKGGAVKVEPYAPVNVPTPIGDGIWLVDGPVIGFRYLGLELPFPTRMTVVRLADGMLWVHSPIALEPALGRALRGLGPVRQLIAPNQLHYWWLGDWRRAYPDAMSFGPPGNWRRALRHGVEIDRMLDERAEAAWAGEIDQLIVAGRLGSEAVFFHRPSRTLILADLIENFEPARIASGVMRGLVRLAGCAEPDGGMPRDMRLGFLGRRKALRRAVRHMIEWRPDRIVLAHGRWYRTGGVAELRRAFRWLGPL
jgi:hypothetical protein